MRTRLLAIDLDGTFLTADRTAHPENVLAVQRALNAGIRVVFASGRSAASVEDISKQVIIESAMICSNGGHVLGDQGKELLHLGLTPEIVEIALAYTEGAGVHTSAYTRNKLFFLGTTEWGEIYMRRVRTVMPQLVTPEEVRQLEVLKMILMDTPTGIQRHRKELETRLGDLATLTESEPEYLEILSREANKGHGLKFLSESLSISQAETAAIGDYLNDVEMVSWAGIGGAVANAHEELIEAADMVMPSNNEAGVAKFIDYLIANNRSD